MVKLCFPQPSFGNMDERWVLRIKFPPSKLFTSSPLTLATLRAQLPSRSQCASNHSQTQMKNRRGPLDFLEKPILVWWWNKAPCFLQWSWKLIYWYKQQHLHEVNMLNPWQQTWVPFSYRLLWIASKDSGKNNTVQMPSQVRATLQLKKCKKWYIQHSHTC